MLFRPETLTKIAEGDVTVAFRRWRRPTVRTGGNLHTRAGLLAIDAVERIGERDVTDADARAAGFATCDEVLRELAGGREGELYRIRFHVAGPDPRVALRDEATLTDDDARALAARLERLDRAGPRGPWTRETLRLIAAMPEVRAGDLAEKLGRERLSFKTDVRKLKAMGLTESLEVGYRLSPRGRALLALLDA